MMKNEAGVRIEEMLCQLADATRIDGEIWRAAYTLEDKTAKNILREWIEDLGADRCQYIFRRNHSSRLFLNLYR